MTARWPIDQSHLEYAERVGPPRAVPCVIELGSGSNYRSDGLIIRGGVWRCLSHEYEFDNRPYALDGRLSDHCPMSRLEEWRAHQWEFTA